MISLAAAAAREKESREELDLQLPVFLSRFFKRLTQGLSSNFFLFYSTSLAGEGEESARR